MPEAYTVKGASGSMRVYDRPGTVTKKKAQRLALERK
jgi:hypothetical protein